MELFWAVIVMLFLALTVAGGASAAATPLDVPSATGDVLDTDDLAQRVLAQHWKEFAPREQEEFTRLFGDVVTRSVARIRARVNHDIVIDRASLVSNFRSQFHAILGASSVAGLLERMRADASRDDATATEPETTRGRLLASLLVGAAVSVRGTR
jgi:ABC-type transporter MlaC component